MDNYLAGRGIFAPVLDNWLASVLAPGRERCRSLTYQYFNSRGVAKDTVHRHRLHGRQTGARYIPSKCKLDWTYLA